MKSIATVKCRPNVGRGLNRAAFYGKSGHKPAAYGHFEFKRNGGWIRERRVISQCQKTGSAGGSVESSATQNIRDDDILPDNLADALFQAGASTAAAIESGSQRCIVELLIPSFWDPVSGPVFNDEGDSLRFWKLNRKFLENLKERLPEKSVKALFPDMGVAVMLQNLWKDAEFKMESINSRVPVTDDDDVVVLAAPDPQGVEDCRRVVEMLREDGSVIMFNPRLSSGEAGVGLNFRRLQERFLSTFLTTYFLQPIGDIGSVFRKFPGLWCVFIEDETTKGRYKLISERSQRPSADELDSLLRSAEGENASEEEKSQGGLLESVTLPIRSFQRFMKSLM